MNENVKITIPTNVIEIASKLEEKGYETYIVGGCVRDAVLNKIPHDWDITTSAPVDVIRKIFSGKDAATLNIAGSLEHGVCFVLYKNEQYEIATFRKDGDYKDGRHCDVVTGVPLYEDLKRRDFTINAMAMRITTGEFVDYFNGLEDCKQKRIVAVGDAYDRLNEDSLRILRAFRFAGQLGFTIDEDIKRAAIKYRKNLRNVSFERISNEFTKIICCDDFQRILIEMDRLGTLDYFFPEFHGMLTFKQYNPHHCYTVGMHSLVCMENVSNNAVMRYAALLHDYGKLSTCMMDAMGIHHYPNHGIESEYFARDFLKRLKFDNEFVDTVCTIVKYHDAIFTTKKQIRRFLGKYSKEILAQVMEIRKADVLAQNKEYKFEEKLNEIEVAKAMISDVLENENAFSKKDMKLSGKDLIAMGYKPGKELGDILSIMYEFVLENPELNEKEILINKVKEL